MSDCSPESFPWTDVAEREECRYHGACVTTHLPDDSDERAFRNCHGERWREGSAEKGRPCHSPSVHPPLETLCGASVEGCLPVAY